MHLLDNVHNILMLDKSGMNKAIKDLTMQLSQAFDESQKIDIPDEYKDIDNVVISGMGGSALGGNFAMSVFFDKLNKPVEVVNKYSLPGYVNERTLVFLVSNSGNTEEILSAANLGLERKAKLFGITTGGELERFFETNNIPKYTFDQKYNQTGQPRMSTGYVLISLIVFFVKCGVINININDISNAINELGRNNSKDGLEIVFDQNPAKQLADKLHGKIPFIIGAEFLAGSIHTFANQINENAKSLSNYYLIPEVDHHLLEGLGYEQNRNSLIFLLVDSELYPTKIRQRFDITRNIIEKNNFEVAYHVVRGSTPLSQALSFLQTASYVSYYLAMLNNIDPTPIPWVNFLKNELKDINENKD